MFLLVDFHLVEQAGPNAFQVLPCGIPVAEGLVKDERWSAEGLEPDPRVGVWTDDFHNLLSVFKR